MTQEVFDSSTTWTCPEHVISVQVEGWGSGAGGGAGGGNGGNGGGGGAYSIVYEYPVTPGNNYTVTVGVGGAANFDGAVTEFDGGASFQADYGKTAGTGGSGPGSTGDLKYSGGDGGAGDVLGGGGGGGSSAGPAADGGNGTAGSGTTGGAGGTAPTDGGAGGAGGNITVNGVAGTAPGGGGGGEGAGATGGAGANGRLILSYEDSGMLFMGDSSGSVESSGGDIGDGCG